MLNYFFNYFSGFSLFIYFYLYRNNSMNLQDKRDLSLITHYLHRLIILSYLMKLLQTTDFVRLLLDRTKETKLTVMETWSPPRIEVEVFISKLLMEKGLLVPGS